MKKIIFFDADGTLWYPKSTKYKKHPVWIWEKYRKNPKKARKELVLIPAVLITLKKLKKLGIKLIVLSTSPRSIKEANIVIKDNIKYFKLTDLFDEIHSTRDYHSSKSKYILEILKKYKISKKNALMVGDSYNWDYKPAQKIGVDAVLIESGYVKKPPKLKRIIRKMSEIFRYV